MILRIAPIFILLFSVVSGICQDYNPFPIEKVCLYRFPGQPTDEHLFSNLYITDIQNDTLKNYHSIDPIDNQHINIPDVECAVVNYRWARCHILQTSTQYQLHSLDSIRYGFPKDWNESDTFLFRTSPSDSLKIYGRFLSRKPVEFEDETDTLVWFQLFALDEASKQLPLHQFQISLLKSGGFHHFFYVDPEGTFHSIERLPLFKSFLNEFHSYQEGDEFHYASFGRGHGTNSSYIIISRTDDPQGHWIKYIVKVTEYKWVAGGEKSVKSFIGEWSFNDSKGYGTRRYLPHALDSFNHERYSLNFDPINRYTLNIRHSSLYQLWPTEIDDTVGFCFMYSIFDKDNIYEDRSLYRSGVGFDFYSSGYPGFNFRNLSYHRNDSSFSGSPVYIPNQETDTINPKLVIFPNPAHDFIRCSYGYVSDSIDASLQIIDMRGITVLDKPLIHHLKPIDISHLQSGIYWAIVRWGEHVERQKIVVW